MRDGRGLAGRRRAAAAMPDGYGTRTSWPLHARRTGNANGENREIRAGETGARPCFSRTRITSSIMTTGHASVSERSLVAPPFCPAAAFCCGYCRFTAAVAEQVTVRDLEPGNQET